MKYVWIAVVVVLLVRVDFVIRFFDKVAERYQNSKRVEIKANELVSETELVSVRDDMTLKSTPRRTFLSLLDDFQVAPHPTIRERALELLKNNQGMFTQKLDKDLESSIFKWRDLMTQKNKSAQGFLLELMKLVKGENLDMLKHFFSYAIDVDIKDFLTVYSKSDDTNCLIMGYLGDRLSDQEKYNELLERAKVLDAYVATPTFDPQKPFAEKCQIVLRLELDKSRGASQIEVQAPETAPLPTGTTP